MCTNWKRRSLWLLVRDIHHSSAQGEENGELVWAQETLIIRHCGIMRDTTNAAYRKCGWGGKLSFQNVGEGIYIYDVLTLKKSRGARVQK